MDLDGFITLVSWVLVAVCAIGKWWCDRHVNMKNWR